MTGLVVNLDNDVLSEILQRDLGAGPGSEIPDFISPLFKLGIVGYASLQCDWFKLRFSGRLAAAAWITAFAMSDDLGASFERANLC